MKKSKYQTRLVVLTKDGRRLEATGRNEYTLALLIAAARKGLTAGEANPPGLAFRWSVYVHAISPFRIINHLLIKIRPLGQKRPQFFEPAIQKIIEFFARHICRDNIGPAEPLNTDKFVPYLVFRPRYHRSVSSANRFDELRDELVGVSFDALKIEFGSSIF